MRKQTKKKSTGPSKATLIFVSLGTFLIVGGLLIMTVLFVVIAWVVQMLASGSESSRESVLERYIDGYQYYFSGREMTEYSYESWFQGSEVHMTSSVELDKIPELLKTKILKDCKKEGFACKEPFWRESTEWLGVTDDIIKHVPGEYCTWAENTDTPYLWTVTACVNTETGFFRFHREKI